MPQSWTQFKMSDMRAIWLLDELEFVDGKQTFDFILKLKVEGRHFQIKIVIWCAQNSSKHQNDKKSIKLMIHNINVIITDDILNEIWKKQVVSDCKLSAKFKNDNQIWLQSEDDFEIDVKPNSLKIKGCIGTQISIMGCISF